MANILLTNYKRCNTVNSIQPDPATTIHCLLASDQQRSMVQVTRIWSTRRSTKAADDLDRRGESDGVMWSSCFDSCLGCRFLPT